MIIHFLSVLFDSYTFKYFCICPFIHLSFGWPCRYNIATCIYFATESQTSLSFLKRKPLSDLHLLFSYRQTWTWTVAHEQDLTLCFSVFCLFLLFLLSDILLLMLCAKSLQSCLTLCNLMDCSPPGSSVHWILQARLLEWIAIFSSSGSSQPRGRTGISCIGRRILWGPP